ncbi:MAG: APC family permease [Bacteroidales bacterium]|nr:APC family permease [Bacteroidales bacterium]
MDKNKIGLLAAVSIGIGGMVGGGIFAVLGLAVELSKGGTPIAFLFAGIIALITSYSYAHLSLTYPNKGGTVKFMNVGFGKNVFSGGTNNLLWISYIIMLSLYASAFGAYGASIIKITGNFTVDKHILLSAIIIFSTLLNYISFKAVSIAESFAVYIKIFILVIFVIIGFYGLGSSHFISQLNIEHWVGPFKMLSGGMVIFVAYEGFELIANAAPNIKNPGKNVPRSYYYSVLFVILLYILIAIITVGSVSFGKIATAQEYVLAVAAEPMLGKIGFMIIGITALISTFSAINVSLYGGSRVNFELAEDDEISHEFTTIFWNEPIGLLVTAVLTLVIANIFNLESISTSGSAGFLLIFGLVNFVNYKLAKETSSLKFLSLSGFLLCFIALVALMVQQFRTRPEGAIIGLSIIVFAYILEWIFKKLDKTTNQPA